MVPVILFGYSVAIGFGEESLLTLRVCLWKRVGIVNVFARLKSSKMSERLNNCMLKKQDEELLTMFRNEEIPTLYEGMINVSSTMGTGFCRS
jgi:hypothetical protein